MPLALTLTFPGLSLAEVEVECKGLPDELLEIRSQWSQWVGLALQVWLGPKRHVSLVPWRRNGDSELFRPLLSDKRLCFPNHHAGITLAVSL